MLRSHKINTAILICSAFIFRILLINIGIISSLHTPHGSGVKSHFSTVLKRRNLPQSSSGNNGVLVVEICEEDSDDDDQFKLSSSVARQFLYALVSGKTENIFSKIAPFSSGKAYTLPLLYLIFQVFRI